jgi:hypothetical protein
MHVLFMPMVLGMKLSFAFFVVTHCNERECERTATNGATSSIELA